MAKKEKQIFVVGHKNPDTDSVASAIAYAELKTELGQKATPLIASGINQGTKLALETFGVKCPERAHLFDFPEYSVVLVDHNESGQWAEGIKVENVVEVIDHHRVGKDFSTEEPIFIRTEPVGATSTIIAKMYQENNKKPEIHVAGLLLSAILTDTLMLKSPTCTDEDEDMANWLNKRVKIDMEAHAKKIFAVKSDISSLSAKAIIIRDYKEFHFNHKTRVGIAMLETIAAGQALQRKEEFLGELRKLKKEENLDFMLFVISDIVNINGYALVPGKEEASVIEKLYKSKEKDGIIELAGVVSRKKQVVPPLEEYFSTHGRTKRD